MDLINKFLNLVAPPFTWFSLLFFVPPYYFFNLFLSILRSFFSENVAGKVVLITGASSGIGEINIYRRVIFPHTKLPLPHQKCCYRSYLWKLLFPELIEWISRVLLTTGPGSSPKAKEALSKKILDVTGGAKNILYPETVQIPENQTE